MLNKKLIILFITIIIFLCLYLKFKNFNFKILNKKNKKCAILYFGLLRSVSNVYETHNINLKNELSKHNIDYKVFVHSWKTENNHQKVWNKLIDTKQNYNDYKFLNPHKVKFEKQKTFIDNIDFSKYFYKKIFDTIGDSHDGEWLPFLVKNHLCALESQKRVLNMAKQEYFDYVIFIRPDVMIKNKFPIETSIKYLDNNENGIIITNFEHNEGYNDRFAMINMKYASEYANRINYLSTYRKNYGRIVSEKYTKFIVDKYYKPLFVTFNFDLIRPK